MALTISNTDRKWTGSGFAIHADVAFDSSYAFGGETLQAKTLGIDRLERVIIEPKAGLSFEYDYTNETIKVFAPAPPVVFEELVTVTDNVGTLAYPAAFIMYVGSGNAAYKTIAAGLTPVTGSCAVSEFAWGERPTLTFLAGDSVTSCYVTYVTQAWKEVFDNIVYAKMTGGVRVSGHADLTFTSGTPDTVDLGEYAVAIQSVTWNDNGTIKPMKACYLGVDPATTEVAIDFTNSTSSETRCSFREEDTVDAATDSVYFTYIRKPTSGFLYDRFIEEDDLTPSSDVVTTSSGLAVGSNMLIYGSCGCLPGPTGGYASIIRSAGTQGVTATLCKPTSVNNNTNTFTFGSDHADGDHVKPSYICGYPYEITGLVPLEVRNATDLSWVTGVKVTFQGV